MILEFDGFALNDDDMHVVIDGNAIDLTVCEFNILYKLASNPNRILSRGQLEVNPIFHANPSRAVDIHIANIRKKLRGLEAPNIVTVYGLGYKLVPSK